VVLLQTTTRYTTTFPPLLDIGDPQNPPAAQLPVFFPLPQKISSFLSDPSFALHLGLASLPLSALSAPSAGFRCGGLGIPPVPPLLVSSASYLPLSSPASLQSASSGWSLKKPPSPHPLADGALILPIFLPSSSNAAAWFLLGRHSYIKTPLHHDPRTSTSLHPHLAGQSTDNRAAQTLRRAEPSGASTLEPQSSRLAVPVKAVIIAIQ
jgi:hypothetical protein